MRITLIVALLAARAAAQASPYEEMRWSFWSGLDISIAKAFGPRSVEIVARSPEKTLRVCCYAVDTSFKLTATEPLATAEFVQTLAESAKANDDCLETRWAGIEARIYREKLVESYAAQRIRVKYTPEEPMADHPERWKRYTAAAAELARAVAGTERAVEGIQRALEFQLQACHWVGADRDASIEGLKALEKMLADESKDVVAAARATVLLAEAEQILGSDATAAGEKIRKGLELLGGAIGADEPDRNVIRRYNDFVTLARLHPELGLEAEYHLVACEVPEKGMQLSLPLSRAWRTLSWTTRAPRERRLEIYRLNPAGGSQSEVSLTGYDHGFKYPGMGAKKQADGKDPRKLATALFERDKDFGLYRAAKKRKRTRPRRVRLNHAVKSAYYYEVLTQGHPKVRPWYYRLRVWILPGKERSYGIRLHEGMSDGVEEVHPELAAVLESIRVE